MRLFVGVVTVAVVDEAATAAAVAAGLEVRVAGLRCGPIAAAVVAGVPPLACTVLNTITRAAALYDTRQHKQPSFRFVLFRRDVDDYNEEDIIKSCIADCSVIPPPSPTAVVSYKVYKISPPLLLLIFWLIVVLLVFLYSSS